MTDHDPSKPGKAGPDRRTILQTIGAAGIATATSWPTPSKADMTPTQTIVSPGFAVDTKLTINGKPYSATIDPRTTLLDFLREHVHLTGTKKGCDHGQCGACTVHVDGRRVNSCLTFAAALGGKEITTIEGLGEPGNLHPMQAAFVEHDGYQCGYCTSGQIMSAVALMKEPCGPTDNDVRELMSGNICRCGAYQNIVAAIQQVRQGT